MSNTLKTTILLASLTGLLILFGRVFGGEQGMMIAFVIALGMNFASYWYSDKIVLTMYRAREVTEADAPEYYRMVERLATRSNMPMPKVYIIPNPQPNAFATGRDPKHAAVAATEGIMRLLTLEELEGVMAHELAHVKHRDTLISTIAASIGGAIVMLAHFGRFAMFFGGMGRAGDDDDGMNPLAALLMILLAPIAAAIIQMAVSRSREYAADRGGAEICGNPLGLANALQKLEAGANRIPMDANAATAHMFIVNPLSGRDLAGLFSTHPPTEERVARLQEMARQMDQEAGRDRTFRRFLYE